MGLALVHFEQSEGMLLGHFLFVPFQPPHKGHLLQSESLQRLRGGNFSFPTIPAHFRLHPSHMNILWMDALRSHH